MRIKINNTNQTNNNNNDNKDNKNKKNNKVLFIIFLLVTLFSSPLASALSGVGVFLYLLFWDVCLGLTIYFGVQWNKEGKEERLKKKKEIEETKKQQLLDNGLLYEIAYMDTRLRVYKEGVSFSPKGLWGVASRGVSGEKLLFFKDISAIQWREPDLMFSGFIEFATRGVHGKQGGGVYSGINNPYRLTFEKEHLPKMREIYQFCLKQINKTDDKSITIQQTNELDDLKKLKELLDEGIITQEEFEAKKKKLLGL